MSGKISLRSRLHHVMDDTFWENWSPAKGSKNNLALIRKYEVNILKLALIQMGISLPMTERMDLFCDDKEFQKKYIFREIESLY